jgi:hypothetical protein
MLSRSRVAGPRHGGYLVKFAIPGRIQGDSWSISGDCERQRRIETEVLQRAATLDK